MQSPAVVIGGKADLAVLEKARDVCADNGLRKVIEAWIEEAKKQIAEQTKKDVE